MTAAGPDKRTARVETRAALRQQMAESRAKAAAVPRPALVNLAIYVGIAQVVLMVAYALLALGFTNDFHKLLLDNTRDNLKDVSYTVNATPPAGGAISANSTSTAAPPAGKTDLVTATQTIIAGGADFTAITLGQPVQFTVTVKNAGTTALSGVSVERSKFSGSGDWTDPKCEQATLDPGASTTCTQTFTLTEGKLHDSLSQFRTQTLLSSGLFALMIIVIGGMIRRGSGGARWGYIVLNVVGAFVGFPVAVLYITTVFSSSLPTVMGAVQSLAALAGLIAIILLVLPASRDYFRATREASGKPPMGGAGGGARAGGRPGGLGSLFGPRPSAAPAAPAPAEPAGESVSLAKSKAKGRTTEASVAKGAELARARAKASKAKSRKTADR